MPDDKTLPLPYICRMKPITKQAELVEFCKQVEDGHYITVDTEFIRDKTYFPRLCLIQIAGESDARIIDPLAEGIDLKPVFALLKNKKLLKVFHACRQDIEIFFMLSGHIPAPIFDTQVAAAVCGYGDSVSYETLVNKIAGQDIDKSSRFTDWSARPLSERQLAYALSDVTHLRAIYDDLKIKIEASGRESWIAEEHAYLSNPDLYQPNPEDAWQRLKFGNMRPKHLAVLRELAKWREAEARKADVPRGRILKDDTLIELAHSMPRKEEDITRLRSVDKGLSKPKKDAIIACVETALALQPSDFPQVPKHKKLPPNIATPLAMLQLLLKVASEKHGVSASIIANKDDLESIALGKTESPALTGWRADIFGSKAQALMEGKLKLSLNAKSKEVVFEEG